LSAAIPYEAFDLDITYFKDFDADILYACIGPMGGGGMFRLRDAPHAAWEFLVPESPDWDAIHQMIFRNHRVTSISVENLPAGMPNIPEVPPGPFPEWTEYFAPKVKVRESEYTAVARLFKIRPGVVVSVFVVLFEDQYESAFGDGVFHYFQDVFLTREEAETFIERNAKEWTQYHLRTISISITNEVFDFPDWKLERYDRYDVMEVLKVIEARLRS
jgi:hypothetical protein